MKYFIGRVELIDGGNEYSERYVIQAENIERAQVILDSKAENTWEEGEKMPEFNDDTAWYFEGGSRLARAQELKEIRHSHYKILKRYF